MLTQKFGGTTKSIMVFLKKACTFRRNNLQHKSSKHLVQRESVYLRVSSSFLFFERAISIKTSFDREKKLLLIALQEINAKCHSTFILKMS